MAWRARVLLAFIALLVFPLPSCGQQQAQKPLDLEVKPAALLITTTVLPAGVVGTPYQNTDGSPVTLEATGGMPTYDWSLATGTLPSGLSFSSISGVLSGTPTAFGTTSLSFMVKDTVGTTDIVALPVTIDPALLEVSTETLPTGIVGTQYNFQLEARGGVAPYRWSVIVGLQALTDLGLGLSPEGLLFGIPVTDTGGVSLVITVEVVDSSGTALRFEVKVEYEEAP